MKLSKQNAARQRAIRKAIASGKALGGLLAGLAAVSAAGCRDRSPAGTMGLYPMTEQVNSTNEIDGDVEMGEAPLEPEPEGNAACEAKGSAALAGVPLPDPDEMNATREMLLWGSTMGKMPAAPKLPSNRYRVRRGDTLTKIAKAHGTTVEELKRINGFDDARADGIKAGEIIKIRPVEQATPGDVRVEVDM